MSEYDLKAGNALLEERIAEQEVYFRTKKIGKPEAKVMLESRIKKIFKNASGVDVQYLDASEFYEPYIHISGKYSIKYLKRETINLPITHEVIGAKVCPDCKNIFDIGEPREGEEKKKRNLPIDVVLKLIHTSGEIDLAFDSAGKEMDPKKILDWKKEQGESNFIEQNKDSIRRFSITTQEAIDRLRKKITVRPTELHRILEEIFEITKNEIILHPVFIYTLQYHEETKKVQIDTITEKIQML